MRCLSCRHSADLQVLLTLTKVFMKAIVQSTNRMPFGMRFMAHEMFEALKVRQVSFIRRDNRQLMSN